MCGCKSPHIKFKEFWKITKIFFFFLMKPLDMLAFFKTKNKSLLLIGF